MSLSILVVNWNTRDLVLRCVRSVLNNPPEDDYEIIVVDNHSADQSSAVLAEQFGKNPRVQLIAAVANLGFARGVNEAYRHSRGEFILLLNPDTEVLPGALQSLVQYLERNPSIGVVGPKLLNNNGSIQPSVRRFPDIWSALLVFAGLHRFLRPKKYLMDGFDYESTAEVDQVMGAALITRRTLIDKLGFLDEHFWLWYEEVDFCKRVKRFGAKVVYCPAAAVRHEGARSFSQMDVWQRKSAVAKSLWHYFRKNGGVMDLCLISLFAPFILVAAGLISVVGRIFRVKITPHV